MVSAFKKFIFFILITLPAAAQTPVAARVDTLLAQMPAESEVVTRLLVRALLETGEPGIAVLCSRVQADSSQTNSRARFALQAISTRLDEVARTSGRRMYLDGLLTALRERHEPGVRAFFLQQLQLCGGDESVKTVAALLHDVRLYREAVRTLQAIGGGRAEKALVRALTTVPEQHRLAIVNALGEWRSSRSRKALRALLDDADADVRDAVLIALARSGDEDILPHLQKELLAAASPRREALFAAWQEGVRQQFHSGGVEAARRAFRAALQPESGFAAHERLAVLQLFGRNDPAGQQALLDAARHVNREWRAAALRVLQELPGESVSQALIELTAQLPDSIKPEIYRALGAREDDAARAAIVAALRHAAESVRLAACSALANHADEQAAAELLETLPDLQSERELRAWERALNRVPLREEQVLADFFTRPVPARIVVLRVAEKRRMRAAAEPARHSLATENAALRAAAMRAWFSLMPPDQAAEAVRFALGLSSREQRDAIRLLKDRLADPRFAQHVDRELAKALDSGDPFMQHAALRLAARLGGRRSLDELVEMTDKPESRVYAAAVRALAAWPDEQAVPALFRIAEREDNPVLHSLAMRAIVRLLSASVSGGEMSPAEKILRLEQAIATARQPAEKKQALAAIGDLPAPRSLQVLARYFSDPELALTAAQAALRVLKRKGLEAATARAVLAAALPDSAREEFDNHQALLLLNEPPQGFQPLFNGADLEGWLPDPHASWRAQEGLLRFSGTEGRVRTRQHFRDFELLLDWRSDSAATAALEIGSGHTLVLSHPRDAGVLALADAGRVLPRVQPVRPAGEWNSLRLRREKGTLRVWLNGIELFGGVQAVADTLPAPVILHARGGRVAFRSLFLREVARATEKFSGFLFNGKDLSGWQEVSEQPGNWQVADGVLFTEGTGGGWLATQREFGDFRLELEFRLPEGGNSGVFLRAPLQGNPAFQGLEIQILDDYAEKYAKLKPWQYCGSIYAVQAPSQRASKKAGTWQKLVIISKGPRIRVDLNGVEIIDADLVRYMHKAAAHPGLKRRRGFIGLQNHSTRVEYRNIFLTEE